MAKSGKRKQSSSRKWIGCVVLALLVMGLIGSVFGDSETAEEASLEDVSTVVEEESDPAEEEEEADEESSAEGESSEEESSEEEAYPAGEEETADEDEEEVVDLDDIPEYEDEPYVVINDNVPFFEESDLTTTSFETYSELDSLDRCGEAYACIGTDLMPTEEREDISSVYPSGWVQASYDNVDGGYLYNRCHLIGYQLTAENDNEKNLITGTRYMNVEGMLPFENLVADYIEETENHVLYRVTPIFEGDNLVASGVLMEAMSVEDDGEGVMFCVYCYNVQPDITIDYETGESESEEGDTGSEEENEIVTEEDETESETVTEEAASETASSSDDEDETLVWIPTHGGTKYHSNASCSNMVDPEQVTLSEAEAQGYTACQRCH